MIAVDTSALMAIVLLEPKAGACAAALEAADDILISAGTMSEALIVSVLRGVGNELSDLLDQLGLDIIPVSSASARRIGAIYQRWGKGIHPAALNLGDCFAYDVAKQHSCPLLFIGNDFSRTHIESVL